MAPYPLTSPASSSTLSLAPTVGAPVTFEGTLEPVGGLDLELLARSENDASALSAITQMILEVAQARSGAQRPSMAQDVRKGRRTEIDDINGLVARRGSEVSIDVSLHLRLTQVMKRVERGELSPGPELLQHVVGSTVQA